MTWQSCLRTCTVLIFIALTAITAFADGPSYDREAGAYYARLWSQGGGNPYYYRFGNDCTNFASQALRAGGLKDVTGPLFPRSARQNRTVWWYDNLINKDSWTWDNADYLASFLLYSGRGHMVNNWSDLEVGDVVQMIWRGESTIGHSAIVTLIDRNGMIHLSQHDEDRLDKPLSQYPPDAEYIKWHINTGPLSNNATFVQDITVADGSPFNPNQALTKIWQIKNTGSLTWGPGYHWVFDGGDKMGGPDAVDVPYVSPGQTWSPSVSLTAPTKPGTYQGYWRLQDLEGRRFGSQVWVQIRVQASASVIVVSESDTAPRDGAAGFFRHGTPGYWRDAWGVGDGGHMLWTWNNAGFIDNMGDWRPGLAAPGRYEVSVFIPRLHGTTTRAHYEVYHADGRTDVIVNQNNAYDAWVSLGTYRFVAGTSGLLRLTDMTGERGVTTQIGFDSARWTPRN
jgi:hypothetical protein